MAQSFDQLGKVSRKFLDGTIFRNLGARNPAAIIGPGHGFDNAVLSLGDKRVLVVTADPLSIMPSVGMEESARLTIHLLASDFTTSALTPQFAMLDFNLPPEIRLEDFERYIKALGSECKKLGITIVGGHTGKYPGCGFTIVGGGVLFGMGSEDRYLAPSMLNSGDKVIMTKGAAFAATGFLSKLFPNKVGEELGGELLDSAKSYLSRCSTVKDAIVASSVGVRKDGITAMHDATEGGVLGALYELSSASRKAIVVERERIFISRETRSICSLFRLDPLTSLSAGTLLITCRPNRVDEVQRRLSKNGIESFVIGTVMGEREKKGLWISAQGKKKAKPFMAPEADPYWTAYLEAVARGWN